MALQSKVGNFAQATSTGNQAITGVGFQPKIVFFFGNQQTADGSAAHSNLFFGVATSSSDRRVMSVEGKDNVATTSIGNGHTNVACIRVLDNAATVKSLADFVSMDSDGFTVNWTTADATARIVNYLALGGADLTNTKTGSLTIPAATGNKAVTGVGFKPDLVIFFNPDATTVDPEATTTSEISGIGFMTASNQGYSGYRNRQANTGSLSKSKQSTSACIAAVGTSTMSFEASYVSMDSDGFTVNFTTVDGGSLDVVYYIALKGGQYKIGSLSQATATGNQATTGVGFKPVSLWLQSDNNTSGSSFNAGKKQSLGMGSSSSARGSIFSGSVDAANPTQETQNLDRTKILKMMTSASGGAPTTQAAADLVSLDTDGFTLNWTSADTTARQILYLAFGSNPTIPNKLFQVNQAVNRTATY